MESSMRLWKKIKKLPICITPFSLCFFLLLLWLEPSGYTLIPMLCALLHEFGHVVALRLCGRKITRLRIYPFGLDLRCEGIGSYRADLFVHSAGILCNLICCAFAYPHLEHLGVQVFFASHLLLALLNLFPVENLDGGAMLCAVLCRFLAWDRAYRILRRVSFGSLILLWLLATYLLFFTQENFSLFSMTLYLFGCLFLGKNQSSINEHNEGKTRI